MTSHSVWRRLVKGALTVSIIAASAAAAALAARQGTPPAIPKIVAGVAATPQGALVFQAPDEAPLQEVFRPPIWTVEQVRGNPRGTENGLAFDFGRPGFAGTLIFGLIPYADTKYPQPVFRTSTPIADGKAEVNIKTTITDRYDMVGWQKAGTGVLGYRIVSQTGGMIYDGRVRFRYAGAGPFTVDATLVEGPFVGNVTPGQAVVSFLLDQPAPCAVTVGAREFPCKAGETRQEIPVGGLQPGTSYAYTVKYGANEETYGFRTAPKPGSRKPFVFAYGSDSRGGQGGGERNFNGPNAYIVRRLMAVTAQRNAAFMQFTGDLVSGYVTSTDQLTYELANWKRAIEPQAHWMPVYTGLGNHEAILREFSGARSVRLARFPYDTESSEAIFARELVNPENGPASEDGAPYDPDPSAADFPSYRRNVFWYQYDNVAMVVLNSNYWFTPTVAAVPGSGGNLHGYLMDQQMAWLEQTLDRIERDAAIDHVFLTVHTPVFPNGGHVGDAMWYGGNNTPRATVAGKPLGKGIIERRDDLLRLIQAHPKVLAVLTGDEHNYNKTRLDAKVPIYPPGWDKPKVELSRPFWQINNGAAGAPYYAQDETPWSAAVSGFSTQHALCLLIVEGPKVRLETVNPETLEVLDRAVLR
jgi:hypothetical protein